MAAETFFADPSFEGFNLLFEPDADHDAVGQQAEQLMAERLGLHPRKESVGDDLPPDGAPREIDLLVEVVDSPEVGPIWDLTYELQDLPGVADAEPLWELSQDEFAEEPAAVDDSEVLTRIGVDPSAVRPRTRRAGDGDGPPADIHWSVKMVEAPAAWQLPPQSTGAARGSGVLVGHPDSGFIDHYELHRPGEVPDRFLEQRGFDFLDGGTLQSPDGTHGTSTASVIMSSDEPEPGGRANVMGIAPEAEIIPYRVTKKHGMVPAPILFRSGARRLRDAIYRATAEGCDVISISLGWMKLRSLHRAIRHAVEHDVIVLAAAGNYVWRVVWPARYPEVIAVAGCTHNGQKWWGSSRGRSVDITAPAKDVYRATVDNGVGQVAPGDGTSYAVATVAGIASLWVAHHGRQALVDRYQGVVPLAEVFNHVLATSANPGPVDHGGRFGRGIANAEAALRSPLPTVDEVTAPERRRRSPGGAGPSAGPLDDEFELDDAEDRARHAVALGLPPSALDTDVDDLSDELFFHIFTDPARREAALGPDSAEVGELRHGTDLPATRSARRGGVAGAAADDVDVGGRPTFSRRLAERLAVADDGQDDGTVPTPPTGEPRR